MCGNCSHIHLIVMFPINKKLNICLNVDKNVDEKVVAYVNVPNLDPRSNYQSVFKRVHIRRK